MYVGGLIGAITDGTVITQSYFNGTVESNNNGALLVGIDISESCRVSDCYVQGTLKVNNDSSRNCSGQL